MVLGSDRFTMKYRMSGRTARTRDEVLASGSRVSNKISEGMSGVAGQVVRGHQALQQRTNTRITEKAEARPLPTSSGSLYSDPSVLGKDTTAERPKTMGGGQGSVFGAGCVSRYLTQGGRPANRKNIKKANKFCGIK